MEKSQKTHKEIFSFQSLNSTTKTATIISSSAKGAARALARATAAKTQQGNRHRSRKDNLRRATIILQMTSQ